MLPPQSHATLLSYQTSRDIVGGGDDNSVSYMAVIFSNGKDDGNQFWQLPKESGPDTAELTDEEKKALLTLARRALKQFVDQGTVAEVASVIRQFPSLGQPAGVFVTLYKAGGEDVRRKEHKELRGCIGYIYPVKSLAQAVVDNAIGSASKDPRFQPVKPDEVDALQIDINVLTPPKPIDSSDMIQLGRDGVIMYKAGRQSVFLPSVATEFGWTLEEMLSQLSLKAGLGVEGWRTGSRFDVFQATSFSECSVNDQHQ
jgi:AmmeMemoRadiSam system protein A